MSELSIKLTIANRVYPLTIKSEEEENVRKAAKLVEKKMKYFEKNYAVRDTQDLLAMCTLQFATVNVENESKKWVEDDGVSEKLDELTKLVSDTIDRQ